MERPLPDGAPAPARAPAAQLDPAWHYHFLGIGGVGMSAVAELMARRGFRISGSDTQDGPLLQRLSALGVPIGLGHSAAQLAPAQAVIYTPAVAPTHPIWTEVARRGLPRLHRVQALAALSAGARVLAVCGTHGKTTTTAALGFALARCGADPTVVAGGQVPQFGGANLRIGAGPWWVVEADESDGSFVHLAPEAILLTNVEADHLDHHGNLEHVVESFRAFAARLQPGARDSSGLLVYCADDPLAAQLGAAHRGPRCAYGAATEARTGPDVQVELGSLSPGGMSLALRLAGQRWEVQARVLGRHNALNLAGAFALGFRIGLPPEPLLRALGEFEGVARRQQLVGRWGDVTLYDDYGHHPTEIAATLEMFLRVFGEPLAVVFQPHLYSRTAHFAQAFADALRPATRVYVTEVYGAREQPVPGVSGRMIAERMAGHAAAAFLPDWRHAAPRLRAEVPRGVLLTLGAGDITELGPLLLGGSAAGDRP